MGDETTGTTGLAQVELLGGFGLTCGSDVVDVPLGSQRLMAYLALEGRCARRSLAADHLWPETSHAKALAYLRTAIWRLNGATPGAVVAEHQRVTLSAHVRSDVEMLEDVAQRILDDSAWCSIEALHAIKSAPCLGNLLPEWSDGWVLPRRARLDQLRLHALEVLADRLLDEQFLAYAIETATWAAELDPLRESPRRIIIRAYAKEGNVGSVVREYRGFRALLREELGVDPSLQLDTLMQELAVPRRDAGDGVGLVKTENLPA